MLWTSLPASGSGRLFLETCLCMFFSLLSVKMSLLGAVVNLYHAYRLFVKYCIYLKNSARIGGLYEFYI